MTRTSRKRIAVFTRSLEGGGAERVAVNLANGFLGVGFDVDLLLQYRRGPYLPLVADGIRIVELNRRIRYAVPRLVSYLRTNRPDAMLSILTEPNLGAAVAWRLARMKSRLVLSEHGSLTGARPLRVTAMKSLYPIADRTVAISEAMRDQLTRIGLNPNLVQVIHNPVPLELDALAVEDAKPRGETASIVAIGRLAPEKDFATLIRAFDVLRRERQCTLVILGEGPERPELEALVSALGLDDMIKMPGFVNPPWQVMGKASVLAMSSRWEGWPGVLVEALALGVPVVSTDCPTGPREILDNGKYGKLVPVGDADQLASAISETLDSPPPSRTLRERSRLWRLDLILDQYLDAMEMSAR